MVKLIVNDTSGDVDLSAKNSGNLTALEMAELRRTADGSVDSKDIEDVLRAAAAGGGVYNQNQEHQILINGGNNSNQTLSRSSDVINKRKYLDTTTETFLFNAIVVLAALVATVSFQAALNPPGGVWQDWGNTDAKIIGFGSASKQGSSASGGGEVGLAPSLSPHHPPEPLPSLLELLGTIFWYIGPPLDFSELVPPSVKDVGDENRHMPGKSIARELYADDFLEFIYSCALCFYLSLSTIMVTPLYFYGQFYSGRSSRSMFISTIWLAVFWIVAIALITSFFIRGITLITDEYVSRLVGSYAILSCQIYIGFLSVLILLGKILTEWKFWKWASIKITARGLPYKISARRFLHLGYVPVILIALISYLIVPVMDVENVRS